MKIFSGIFLISVLAFTGFEAKAVVTKNNHHQHQVKSTQSFLNNGKKVKLDNVARSGLLNMKLLVNSFTGKNNLNNKDYNYLGTKLEGNLNNIFQKCTMKGAGHDKLHKLLTLVINDIKGLKGNNPEISEKSFKHLKGLLTNYQKSFE